MSASPASTLDRPAQTCPDCGRDWNKGKAETGGSARALAALIGLDRIEDLLRDSLDEESAAARRLARFARHVEMGPGQRDA